MLDASPSPPDDSVSARRSTSAAAIAAGARNESSRRRLLELQQRLERLRAGQLSTREDVARARLAAEAQRRAFAQAQRRLLAVRSTAVRRPSADAWTATDPTVGAADNDRYRRLREAFVSLASSRPGGTETNSEQDRRRHLTDAMVEQASDTTGSWTDALCRLGFTVVPGVAGSAVSTYDQLGVAHPFAAGDDRSLEIEQVQQVVGEGPGYAAQVDAKPVVVDDLAREGGRWPGYVTAVSGHAIGAVWSFPVSIEGSVLASLTLYFDRGKVPEYRAWGDAAILAGLAAAAMVIDADVAAEGAPTPSHPPDAVDLASGVLAVRAGVRVDQALALLRGRAFSTDRRISDVAADVLAGSIDLG